MDRIDYSNQLENFASAVAEKHYRPDLNLEPIHQTINLSFSIKEKTATGSVSTIIKANNTNVHTIKFDAIDFDIHNINCNTPGDFNWYYDGSQISLSWSTPFSKGEEREVTIEYTIKEPISGMYFSYPDEKYPDRPIFVGTDHETERARYWLPCIDHTAVRCTLDFHLTSDRNHTILANGKLIEEKINGDDTKTAHWKLSFLCPSYLLTIAIGEFVSYEDKMTDVGYGEIPIAYFTTKKYSSEDLKRTFDKTPSFLKWMAKKFGPFPYPKYYQYALPSHGGAMENISLVSWNDMYVVDEIFAKEFAIVTDDVNVHEMAHSWFGDAIVCFDFAHNWLKESWATYISTVWREDYLQSKDEADYNCYRYAQAYFTEAKKYQRPIVTNIYDSSWDLFDRHLYPGGAMRIHMLRRMLGDETFWSAVRDYVATFSGKTVETVDFQRILEKHSGQNLQKFFDQWIFSPGYPQLKAKFSFNEKEKVAAITIEQKQENKEKNIGIFSFDLDIEWEISDNMFERQTVEVKDKEHTFYLLCENKPLQVRLDPDLKLLFSLEFNPGADLLKRQLRHGNIMGRILAAQELAKEGKRSYIEALIAAYKVEGFWGVKIELIKALISSPSFAAIEGALQLLSTESDPWVLKSFLSYLKDVRDKQITNAMKRFLDRDDIELYQATAMALQVIGSQRNPKDLPFLQNFKPKHDKKHIIRTGQMLAIGALRTHEALEYLLERLPYGEEPEVIRRSIIVAISEASKWANKETKERIIERLGDLIWTETNPFNLMALVNSLASYDDKKVIKHLESIRPKIAHQWHSVINRKVRSITKGKTITEELTNLCDEFERLQKTTKKLITRIENLEAKLNIK